MQMRVTIAENKKKLFRKECRTSDHRRAKENHSADNPNIKPMQFSLVVAPGEGGYEDICQHIHQHGENHRETSERSHFRN